MNRLLNLAAFFRQLLPCIQLYPSSHQLTFSVADEEKNPQSMMLPPPFSPLWFCVKGIADFHHI